MYNPELKFGLTLKKARMKAGLTQKELADKLYMTQQGVNKWESGERLPRLDRLKDLADILDIDPYEIFFGLNEEYKDDLITLVEKIKGYAESLVVELTFKHLL